MNNIRYTYTRVWKVEDRLGIADTIAEAVETWQHMGDTYREPDKVEAVYADTNASAYMALEIGNYESNNE